MASSVPSESLLVGSSSSATASGSTTLHDLATAQLLLTLKPSSALAHCTASLPTRHGKGGIVISVQEGKALAGVWAWQKDQMLQKIPLPEKLSCFALSPTGAYCAGGTISGHVYLWEVASGMLYNSWDAHYRKVNVLKFTNDGLGLVSASEDTRVSIWSIATLVDDSRQKEIPIPYATLTDHTLPVTSLAVSSTGAFPTHTRLLTASLDHTVKLWSLSSSTPTLLKTWHLPVAPTSLVWDRLQRGFWAAGGDELWAVGMWSLADDESADVLGTGLTRGKEQGWRGEMRRLDRDGEGYFKLTSSSEGSQGEKITTLGLSLTSTTLLVGTSQGSIHTLSLPSLQPLKVIHPQAHKGCPITHLDVLLKPADLYGQVQLGSTSQGVREEVIRKVGALERMRVGRKERERHVFETRLSACEDIFDILPQPAQLASALRTTTSSAVASPSGPSTTALEAQIVALQAELAAAKAATEKLWNNIVDGTVDVAAAAGGEGGGEEEGKEDVSGQVAGLALNVPAVKKAPVGAKKRRR